MKHKMLIAVSRKWVRVTAFCPNPDGTGTVPRVWKQTGKIGGATLFVEVLPT